MPLKFVLATLMFFASSWTFASAVPSNKEVYIGMNTDYSMPLIEIQNPFHKPEISRGINRDVAAAIAQELGLKPVYVLLPKTRVATSLVNGDVSFICHLHEAWQPKIQKQVQWSHDLYKASNLIVFVGKKEVQNMEDLQGKHVGVVVNFVYRDLEPSFEKTQILREDGVNVEANIQKLIHGRINYIVMSNLEFDYNKKLYPNLVSADFEMDSFYTKCALSPKAKINLAQLNKAIDAIKKNGTLDKIMKTY